MGLRHGSESFLDPAHLGPQSDRRRSQRQPGYPLGLQVARLFGPLLLVITGLGVLATLFRNQRDRLSVRLARRVQVVVGLSPETVGLLRRLTESAGPRTSVAVLTGSTDIAMIRSARDHGGAVIMVDPDDTRGLQVLLTAGRRFKMQGAYLMSPDSALNLRWASAAPAGRGRLRCAHVRRIRRGSWCGSTIPGRPSTGAGATATEHVTTTVSGCRSATH